MRNRGSKGNNVYSSFNCWTVQSLTPYTFLGLNFLNYNTGQFHDMHQIFQLTHCAIYGASN